jgi:hypothetical protein
VTSMVLAGIAGKADMDFCCKIVIHSRISVVTNTVDVMTQIAVNWPYRAWSPMRGTHDCKDVLVVPGTGQAQHGRSLQGFQGKH